MSPLEWSGAAVLVFLAATAYDFAAAKYLTYFGLKDEVMAANWGVSTYVVGLVGLAGVLKISPWFCIPEGLGLWTGTYMAVRRAKIVPSATLPEWRPAETSADSSR